MLAAAGLLKETCCRYVRLGSFVEGTAEFDAGAYRLASGEALALDPQARIVLEQTQVVMMRSCNVRPLCLRFTGKA